VSARFWWRRSRFWGQLLAVAAGAAAVGLVVAVLVPSSRAGIAGAAVTAVVTGTVLGIQVQWRRRAEVIGALPAALEISSSAGGFPLVREVSDAVEEGYLAFDYLIDLPEPSSMPDANQVEFVVFM
jgi:hypothetical protein